MYRTSDGAQVDSFTGHAGPLHGIAWTGRSAPTGLYTVGLDSQLISFDLRGGPRTVPQSGPDRVPTSYGQIFGRVVIGDAQRPSAPPSATVLYTLDLRTGRYASWSAGLRDDEVSAQVVVSNDGRVGLESIVGDEGKDFGQNRIEILNLRTHRTIATWRCPRAARTSPMASKRRSRRTAATPTAPSAKTVWVCSRCRPTAAHLPDRARAQTIAHRT